MTIVALVGQGGFELIFESFLCFPWEVMASELIFTNLLIYLQDAEYFHISHSFSSKLHSYKKHTG